MEQRNGRAGGAPASARTGITHIVWDWNGTLLHDVHAVLEATNASFAELGLPSITLERYRELYCVPVPRFYERLMGRTPTEEEWEALDSSFHRHYWQRCDGVALTDGAAELLAERRREGHTQSLCSLAPHDLLVPLVRTHGIDGHFLRVDGALGPSGGGKADQMARHLSALQEVDRARTVVVGDAVDDALAAAHAGVGAVLYTGGSHSRASLATAGVPVVDTLLDAVEVAEAMASGRRRLTASPAAGRGGAGEAVVP
ncbi:haloacid dehalogenase-like hydrolase [Streptomyces sp. N2-109]|uniref:Haloacid dehalogenase-like hydrolase n=1 Tax=Streptomyces gossypii TaxID=2883101 RepID=A0ABT2JV44_9ACTN|nr:HAD family hydrolase [Streptomyces gossypii]MCT2591319.1 haloacid dehalogenase-like hydrolase [Streptomyces gossypii]